MTLEPEEMRATLAIIRLIEKHTPQAQMRILDATANYLEPTARVLKSRKR